MSDLENLNKLFELRMKEYKSRLTPKELKNFSDLDGVAMYFYSMGWTDSRGQNIVGG
jgi:hypothetical protein